MNMFYSFIGGSYDYYLHPLKSSLLEKGSNLLPFGLWKHEKTKQRITKIVSLIIKALTALVGRLALSADWEVNGPERGLKTVSFNP